MRCPKCEGSFETVSYRDVDVDRCDTCAGIWFDFGEQEDLRDRVSAELIDTGNSDVGKDYNEIRDINCPKCHARMIPMTDREQSHIQYEACPKCYGLFFDAGEFTDAKDFTMVERIKELLR